MKKKKLFFFLLLLSVVFSLISIALGAANISPLDALKIIAVKITGGKSDSIYEKIILDIRLPRVILSALVGMGLGVSGAAFQGLFKNPMADPYVLGISSGAALGATISIILKLEYVGLLGTTTMAFIGAFLSLILVYNIAKIGRKVPTTTLLLSGIAVNFLFSAIISLAMILHKESMDRIIFWTMGSFGAASYNQIIVLTPIIIIVTAYLIINNRKLNIMSVAEESAYTLGVDGEKVKKRIILLSSLLVATIVSISGIIGFVGLIIPHIARILAGANHRELIPFSAILGGLFLIICDTLARNIMPPTELPVGVITSIFGAPYFIYLLWKRKRG